MITAVYGKDPTDARWKDDPGFKEYSAFIEKYMTPKDLIDSNVVYGFGPAATMIQVLKQCGNDLSRENVMKQAANLKDLRTADAAARASRSTPRPTTTSRSDRRRSPPFNGESWEQFGGLYQA